MPMPMLRPLLFLAAAAMPVVAWFSQAGAFGPTNGAISDRYPTLLVAAGWAFSIWGVIFALDVIFGIWQWRPRQRDDDVLDRIRPAAIFGFLLTAAWMPVFSQQWFVAALVVIWLALACLLYVALRLSRDDHPRAGARAWAWTPLSLHAGWLSLAAFLNTAQVIVAHGWQPAGAMLPWSLWLFAGLAVLLLGANILMRGNGAYALAAIWGLVGTFEQQRDAALPGAPTAAWIAVGLALLLAVQTLWLRHRDRRRRWKRRAGDR